MVLVVLGIDALDPDLVDPTDHKNLTLSSYNSIDTIDSHTGEPSTHELWPTIITGLKPSEHGIELTDGVTWENPLLRHGSNLAEVFLPDVLQTRIGAWLLTNTKEDAFRIPACYYENNEIETVFDSRKSKPIGIPNFVVDSDFEDREHTLRRSLGDLFERDPEATGGHRTSNPYEFYEQCMEMAMIRTARARRAVRGGRYELVFAYTSGLDLIGHVTYDLPDLQMKAYAEINDFVGELHDDMGEDDELLLVSDHGLQDGVHTHKAMVSSTDERLVESVESVLDIRATIEHALNSKNHEGQDISNADATSTDSEHASAVQERLEDLGYM